MIKLIVGTKGSGKTKAMIDMINDSVKTSKGNVVVVEKGMKLTYEVPNAARLIDLDEYKIAGGEMLYGFVAGLLAGAITGILHTVMGIPAILAGILTQMVLWSVNLKLLGKANQALPARTTPVLLKSASTVPGAG